MSYNIFRGNFFEPFFSFLFFFLIKKIFFIKIVLKIFPKFFNFFWNFIILSDNPRNSIQNTSVSTKIMTVSIKKSLILINNREKIRLAAGLPPGRLLKRRAGLRRPAARGLNGAKNTRKYISESWKLYFDKIGFWGVNGSGFRYLIHHCHIKISYLPSHKRRWTCAILYSAKLHPTISPSRWMTNKVEPKTLDNIMAWF